ncbi:MAG: hypothetical protein ACREF9_07195 [Opitutaceae bacterium]
MVSSKIWFLAIASFLASSPTTIAQAESATDDERDTSPAGEGAVELEPITVFAPLSPYLGDRKLLKLKEQLPDIGSSMFKKGWVERIADFYEANKDPNTLPPLQQEMLLKTTGESE